MQDLKADTVLFLTQREGVTDRDRQAAKLLSRCDVEVMHAGGAVDVIIHAEPEVLKELKSGSAAGHVENAVREACASKLRMLQWSETTATRTTGTGAGVGDGRGAHQPTKRSNRGEEPKPHWDSQGHGSSQADPQPGDRQINPPPNPRR